MEITRKDFLKTGAIVGLGALGTAALAGCADDSAAAPQNDEPEVPQTPYTLQQLCDIEEIKKCKARYFFTMDRKMWDELADCFTEDFRYEMIDPLQGRTAMLEEPGRDKYIEALKQTIGEYTTSHQGHCHEVTLTSDTTADSIIALEDTVDLHAYGLSQVGQAHYIEKYQKCEDGKWRIRRMSIQYIRVRMVPLGENEMEYKPLPDYKALSTIFDD